MLNRPKHAPGTSFYLNGRRPSWHVTGILLTFDDKGRLVQWRYATKQNTVNPAEDNRVTDAVIAAGDMISDVPMTDAGWLEIMGNVSGRSLDSVLAGGVL